MHPNAPSRTISRWLNQLDYSFYLFAAKENSLLAWEALQPLSAENNVILTNINSNNSFSSACFFIKKYFER